MSVENDPWNDAKEWLEQCRATTDVATKRQIAYVDHLNDEIDRLTNRVEELEAEIRAEDEADVKDAQAALANEKRGTIESIEPVLDPARVLATAVEVLKTIDEQNELRALDITNGFRCLFRYASNAKPYQLKGGGENAEG